MILNPKTLGRLDSSTSWMLFFIYLPGRQHHHFLGRVCTDHGSREEDGGGHAVGKYSFRTVSLIL